MNGYAAYCNNLITAPNQGIPMNNSFTILTPDAFKALAQQPPTYSYYQTAAGTLRVAIYDDYIYEVSFTNDQFPLEHLITDLSTKKYAITGTEFQIRVWQAAHAIPTSTTKTYQDIARIIDHPQAWRAVANALANNRIAYVIPCHRVVRHDGSMGGYRWGVERKKRLLDAEKDETS
jgi:O-6-methylguanine DNA methyltransferase